MGKLKGTGYRINRGPSVGLQAELNAASERIKRERQIVGQQLGRSFSGSTPYGIE